MPADSRLVRNGDALYMLKNVSDVMSGSEYLSRFTPNLFWDADLSKLSMDESANYVIQRVLNMVR